MLQNHDLTEAAKEQRIFERASSSEIIQREQEQQGFELLSKVRPLFRLESIPLEFVNESWQGDLAVSPWPQNSGLKQLELPDCSAL